MDHPTPNLGPTTDGSRQLCQYAIAGFGNSDCDQPATWHIRWDSAGENGLACNEHMALAQARMVYDDRHPVGPDCAMPGTGWDYDEKRCVLPPDTHQPTQAHARRTPALETA